ncbi:hypothetical protein BK673_11810 [Pseudomonas fluorescens]|uniref:DUF4435 domain-containing protein n=1 Tax=Pseudomonas fluorescens TaxID=294 RepID=A0A423P5Q3_PSEFL|nr:DUF4435 domain-containing protein [Pseudomonas fluorescens]ROO09586.1 hypothetical protein BK673_11810 [Pseudomonas fluorescens]
MDFLATLKAAIQEPIVLKHNFLVCYDSQANNLHVFFEGKTDESFYGTYLRSVKPESHTLKSYICGNKDGVYYYHKQLSHLYKKEQPLLFFVDKDIEDIIPFYREAHDNIHVTEFYSVENYLVNCDSIEQIWAEIFRQCSGTPIANKISETFSQALDEFHKDFYKVMGWVLYHRRTGSRPNLDCILTKRLFSIGEDLKYKSTYSERPELYMHLDDRTGVSTPVDKFSEVEELESLLKSYEPKCVVRGHNEMDFFLEFFKVLKASVANASDKAIQPALDLTGSNVIDIMGPRTPPSNSLVKFLSSHIDRQLDLSAANTGY